MNKEEIKELRLALKMSQQTFAEKLGVSMANVSKWENGHTKPSKLALQRLKNLQKRLP